MLTKKRTIAAIAAATIITIAGITYALLMPNLIPEDMKPLNLRSNLNSYDELGDIPAVAIKTTANILSLQKLIESNFYPINLKQFHSIASTQIPAGKTPVICINQLSSPITINIDESLITISTYVAPRKAELKIVSSHITTKPSYYKFYDSIELLPVMPIDTLLNNKEKKDYYVSDGVTPSITIPEAKNSQLFFYAPNPGMTVSLVNNNEIVSKNAYLSKGEYNVNKHISKKGIYLTATSFLNPTFMNKIFAELKTSQIDSLVIDAKDIYMTKTLTEDPIKTKNFLTVKKIVEKIHQQGLYASARIWVFQDARLAGLAPDVMVKNQSGSIFKEPNGMMWADPFNPKVVSYNLLFVKAAIAAGFDEIQFDYIRFPTDGSVKDLIFPANPGNLSRHKALSNFLDKATELTFKSKKSLTIDVFGVAVWPEQGDSIRLGQRIPQIARYVDAICPMLYPSHFNNGYEGKPYPGDEPYYFINRGVNFLNEILSDSGNPDVLAIPWIQGFTWRTHIYGPSYITNQIKGMQDAGGQGYLVWNAGNSYREAFIALKK